MVLLYSCISPPFRQYFSLDSAFLVCAPWVQAEAEASPPRRSAVLPSPHRTRGVCSKGSFQPSRSLCQHEMKPGFHKTPHANLSLEIATKIQSFQDPKGHLMLI